VKPFVTLLHLTNKAVGDTGGTAFTKPRAGSQETPEASEITAMVGGRELTSDKIKGKGKEVIGAGKEKLGQMTGDKRLQAEGKSQNVEGKVQKAVGRVKDKATDIKRKVT
jgi:uncharacterized protein YjbJ (UPF0337 family)